MSDPLLLCRGLHKGYPSGETRLEVLRGLDLEVRRGEMVAVTGASGVGKSTLLHLLAGLDLPDRGEVAVDGRRLSGLRSRERTAFRNRRIGIVFQFHHLLPEFSALENVLLPFWMGGGSPEPGRRAAAALLDRLGLGGRLHHHPAQLSGGEQQRVAIARGLVNSPALLLADEPTGNLDTQTAESVFECLRAWNRREGLTVILATHNLRLAQECDRLLHLRHGRLQAGEGEAVAAAGRGGAGEAS
ncbi:MAG: ABC transporter ATP-binding protein [Acidobacteria bacterium]|nr:ABC transporter ATP-binding protein [Acidobacteriota bacterium]